MTAAPSTQPPLAPSSVLPYLGLIPFVGCAALTVAGVESVPVFGSVQSILNAYCVVIATFMAGSYWGIHLNTLEGSRGLAITSNLLAVLIWLVSLLATPYWQTFFHAVVFALLLLVDFKLKRRGILTESYWRTRKRVTAAVILSLLTAGLAHFSQL